MKDVLITLGTIAAVVAVGGGIWALVAWYAKGFQK